MKKGKERERARLTFVLFFSLQVYLPFFLWKIESRWKQEREQGQRAGVLNPNKRKGKKVLCLTLLFVPNYPFSNANVCFYSKDEEEKLRGLHRYGGRTQFLLRESWKGALLISSLASAEEFDNFACRNFMCFTRCFASSLFFLPKVFPLLLTNRALQINVDNDFLPSKGKKKNLVQAHSSGKVHNADLYSYEERINVYSWMTIVACTKMVQNGKNLRSLVSSRSVLYLCGSCKTEGGKGPEPKRQTQEAFPISRSVLLIGQSILHKKAMLVQGWLISSGFTFSRFPVLPELKLWCIAVLAVRRRRVA